MFVVSMFDVIIEEYRKKMIEVAAKDGLVSQRTLEASQNLDQLLNLKMSEFPSGFYSKELSPFYKNLEK
ncbi:aspartyl-phosphate phosphatase Spo0E family protein [Metabacillus herbersteinensis]|uniref:Aspartyl-phosphate phosphatase Spo0E family protein n=1 Tax=Metabacillus herbersteinensis TaxID=283816 RepID=A0ABV6GFP5_9BACI